MVSEFKFINNLKSQYSLAGVGDDCAVLPKDADHDLLVTSDMLIEEIDFRLDWTTAEFLGHKALAVSLSDIAAMGGTPKWALVSIGVPENLWTTGFLDGFYAGWFALANEHKVELVGGDLSRSPDRLVIDSIVGGEVQTGRALLRSTARPGDAIFVSGSLGGSGGGLELLRKGSRFAGQASDVERNLLLRQLQPVPQVYLAKTLMDLGLTTSAIDVSDGLSSDLHHICESSGVGAKIYGEKIPTDAGLNSRFSAEEAQRQALSGGEDYELLFTVARRDVPQLASLDVSEIGEITQDVGIIELTNGDESVPLHPTGYRHF